MKKVKLGLVKKIISIVGLASIASIPAIALVSCSNDSSSSSSGSSGNSGGNNNPGGSNQKPGDSSQQKQYLSFSSPLSVERVSGPDDRILIDNNIEFMVIKENIRNYKWFDENGKQIKYKIKLSLESGFFVGKSCDGSGIDINEPFGPNNFVKRIGNKDKDGAIDAEIAFWKKHNDDNFNSKEDFYIEWFNGEENEKNYIIYINS